MKLAKGQTVIQLFESWSPKKLASMENDPIGLAIGTLDKDVSKVLVTLDVNDAVVDEAIANQCELIIAHHPPIFRKLANLRTDSPQGKLFEKLIKNDIAVYAAHTNLDVAEGGVNDLLADALQIQDSKVLVPTYEESVLKLAVYIPEAYVEKLREAFAVAGIGNLGGYDFCSFQTTGEGRFRALEGMSPFIGEIGKVHVEKEVKLEVIFPESMKKLALQTMKKNHPYEVVAYDLFTLHSTANEKGLGRIGILEKDMTLEEFAAHVKQQLQVPAVRVVGDLQQKIRKVAVLGGDGNKYVSAAKYAGADVFVTGDIYFHVAQDAEALGLSLIDPGHHVESVMKKGVADKMTKLCAENKVNCQFIVSQLSTEPFKFI